MNVFSKVTLESLKKNRTRTIVTIIGIMLSAAMICASTTLVSSMQNFVLRCAIHIDGDWYGAVYDAAYKDYEDIRDSDRVSSAAYAQVLGYAKIDSANERKPYLYVLGGDVASGYFKTMPVHLILWLCLQYKGPAVFRHGSIRFLPYRVLQSCRHHHRADRVRLCIAHL